MKTRQRVCFRRFQWEEGLDTNLERFPRDQFLDCGTFNQLGTKTKISASYLPWRPRARITTTHGRPFRHPGRRTGFGSRGRRFARTPIQAGVAAGELARLPRVSSRRRRRRLRSISRGPTITLLPDPALGGIRRDLNRSSLASPQGRRHVTSDAAPRKKKKSTRKSQKRRTKLKRKQEPPTPPLFFLSSAFSFS